MRWLVVIAVMIGLVAFGTGVPIPTAAPAAQSALPTVPPDYRTWPLASTSLALSYPSEESKLTALARAHLPPATTAPRARSAMAGVSPTPPPAFQNVFVSPAAYASFQKTGLYPNGTVFVLEVRASVSRTSSFLSDGLYQGDVVAMRMELRDDARYPKTQWAWFTFQQGAGGAWTVDSPAPEPLPNCWQCHITHGAVQDSFTQFYPTLFAVAKAHGTVKHTYAR
jgi:hypothetical protein